MAKSGSRNGITAVTLVAVVVGMLGLSFASVPLYRLFCQVTGFGGAPKIAAAPAATDEVSRKTITIRFDANVDPALPWAFAPEQRQVDVRAGESTLAFYKAVNRSDRAITGTATYNVTPYKAAIYFSKIQCFCFTEQRLAARASADMPVQFFVDPEIFRDPNTQDVTTITLSYTFFRAEGDGAGGKTQVSAPADVRRVRG
ncbi:MAG TPA: cytochrome c oxidase assembly protein [Rhodospirillales bacterium]